MKRVVCLCLGFLLGSGLVIACHAGDCALNTLSPEELQYVLDNSTASWAGPWEYDNTSPYGTCKPTRALAATRVIVYGHPDVNGTCTRHRLQDYTSCAEFEPSTCTNGVKDGDEAGIDCGGSCSADCEAICPSNTEYLYGFDGELGCYWYGLKDSLGNCPAGTYASDEFGVTGCYREYSPILGVAGTEVAEVVDMSFQGGSVSTVSQVYPSTTTDNGDGTSTKTTVSQTTGSDGRSTTETKIEIINNSTQQIISSETTKTEETPPEENAGNYDYDIGSGELAETDYSDLPEEKNFDTLFDSVQAWNPFANLDDEMAIETSNAACEFACDLDLGVLGSHNLAFGLCEYDWAFNAIGVVLNFVAVGSAVYIVVRR